MIRHEWLGPNGGLIDLSDVGAGVFMGAEGVEGMGMPPTTAFLRVGAMTEGQTLTGVKTEAREVFWPIVIMDGTRGWFDSQKRLWDSFIPGEYGLWRVTHNQTYRTLECRFEHDGGAVYSVDPSERQVETHGITLKADRPMWRGPRVAKQFQAAQSSGSFFAPPGSDHVFNIGSAGNTDAAVLSNPGDVPAWATVTVSGPSLAFSVLVDGAEISATLTLASGDRLVIDTDPKKQIARLWRGNTSTLFPFFNFTKIRFAPIPRGGSVPVAITVNGSGPVEIGFDPQYRRAY